jgi:anti-sigma regulatory factor (Ser/Thr protein kinase)
MNPAHELFSEERLVEVLAVATTTSAETIVDETVKAVEAFEAGGGRTDDVTVVATRFHGAPVSEVAELKITAKNHLSEIARVITCFEGLAERYKLPVAVNRKTKTIIDEVLNNVICYAYEDGSEQEIVVRLTRTEDEMTVAFEDSGAEFDPLAQKAPDTESSIIDREVGGLGIFLVRKLSDGIHYSRRDSRNVLTVSMRLEQEDTA